MSRVQIGDIVEFRRGISWSSAQESNEARPGLVPVLRIPNIQDRLDDSDLRWLKGITQGQRQRFAASKDWILMVGSNGNPDRIGDSVRIAESSEYLFASFLIGIRPDDARVSPRFLAHRLRAQDVRSLIRLTVRGSTGLQNINLHSLSNYRLELPVLSEQERIADILDAMDSQINESEHALSKLGHLRSGLLHQLISSHAPNAVLGDGLVGSPINGIYKPATLIGRGTLLVGQTAFSAERIVRPTLARRAIVTASELSRFGLAAGDILVSRVFATLEGVGQPALVADLPESAVFESNMMRLRIDQQRADSEFVFLQLQGDRARAHIVQRANLSNQASISQDVLTRLPFWWPSLDVQQEISQSVGTLDRKYRSEQRQLTKLRALKLGLMSDLLTGRVRVPSEAAS